MSNLQFKRRFYTSLDNGLTFFWLKHRYGANVNSAIAKTIRIFYLPSVLGTSIQTQDRVMFERQESVREFEAWMNPKDCAPLIIHIPNRVEIDISLEFPDGSDNGMTLAWMLDRFGGGDKAVDEVIRVVQLVYLPSAFRGFGRSQEQEDAIHQSRTVFCDIRASDVVTTIPELVPVAANGKLQSSVFGTNFNEPPPLVPSEDATDDFDLDLDAIYKNKDD
jgi:hypothetical protein